MPRLVPQSRVLFAPPSKPLLLQLLLESMPLLVVESESQWVQ